MNRYGLMATMWRWAWRTGLAGFVLGFAGPILVTPEANQGPLLGLFITGPVGFVLGGVIGLAVWLGRRR